MVREVTTLLPSNSCNSLPIPWDKRVIKFNAMSFCLVLACAICSHPMVTIVRNKDDNGRESASLLAATTRGDTLAVIVISFIRLIARSYWIKEQPIKPSNERLKTHLD